MKVTVQQDELQRELEFVRPAFSDRGMANTIRLETRDERLVIQGSGSRVSLVGKIGCGIFSEGSCDVQGGTLLNVVKALEKGAISLATSSSGQLEIAQGHFEARLALPATFGGMPDISTESVVTMSGRQLRSMVEAVRESASHEDVPHLKACALLEFTDAHARSVATDGRRLACATFAAGSGFTGNIYVPTVSLDYLTGIAEGAEESGVDVTLRAGDTQLVVEAGDRTLVTGVVHTNYPPYNKILERTTQDQTFNVDRDKLLTAIDRAMVVTTRLNRAIVLSLTECELSVEADCVEDGSRASERITIHREDTSPRKVRANGDFLRDAVSVAPEGDVTFLFGGDRLPMLITSSEADVAEIVSVVMPLVEKK